MKLSNEIKDVLNNFQSINSNIAIGEAGGMIRTMSVSKTLMAKANIEPEAPNAWPYEFGIYDLGEFLACLNMFTDPNLQFDVDKKFVNISDGVTSFKYYFSEIDILTVPTNDINLDCNDLKFTLTNDELNQLRKASASAEFEFVFDINNFKFKAAPEYVFGIDKKQVALINAGNTDYWVALDKTTTYKD